MYDYYPSGKKYGYKRLPMGVANSPEIFQQKINVLFQGIYFVPTYTYELLIPKKRDRTYHVQKLEWTLKKLKESGLKYNTEKYFFRQTKMEYLGFRVTQNCVKPIDKVQAIENMILPTSQK